MSSKPNVINGKEWKLVVTRNMSFWHNVLSLDGHKYNSADFGVSKPWIWLYITVNSTETHVFAELQNLADYNAAVLDAVNTKEKIALLKERYYTFAKELMVALEKADKDLTLENWLDYLQKYQRFTAGLGLTTSLGRVGAEKLTERLKALGYTDAEIPNIIAVITYPKEHTPLFISQLDLLTVCCKVQKDGLVGAELEAALQGWLTKHGCIPVNYCEEPWNMNDARTQLESFLKKDCEKELVAAKESHQKKSVEAEELLAKINDSEVTIYAHALAEGTYLNEFRKNIFCQVSLAFRGMFERIAKMGGSSNWRDCLYLTPDETTALIKGEKLSIADIKNARRVVGMHIGPSGKSELLPSDMVAGLEAYINELHGATKAATGANQQNAEKPNSVKGFSACKGKVTGTVKIILSSKDFHKLNAGEILVTTMTSVDFVPVMERAAAFVTNEGGITSHASIVAREMNKPCVIGTKNATQVLKDGDRVEVDAVKGIVTILP